MESSKEKGNEQNAYYLALKEVKEIGLFSFALEEKREEHLISQATQMLTAFSIFSASILMALPVLLQYTSVCRIALLKWTKAVFVPLIISLCLSILAQWRYRYDGMKDIEEIKKHVYKNIESFSAEYSFDEFWGMQIAPIHKSIMRNNNKRVVFVKISMFCFLISILILVLASFFLRR